MVGSSLTRSRSTSSTFGQWMEGRTNNFDALRFILAVMVIMSHSYPLLLGSETREFVNLLTGGQDTAGGLAVAGFFAISGLLISASWERSRGIGDYFRKRFLRIYPGWIVAWLLTMLLVAPLAVDNRAAFLHGFLAPLNFAKQMARMICLSPPDVQAAFIHLPQPKILNGSMWTIRYEFMCYVLVALLGLTGLLRRRGAMLVLLILCYVGMVLHLRGLWLTNAKGIVGVGDLGQYPRLLTCFMMGAALYTWRDHVPFSPILLGLSLLLLVVTALLHVGFLYSVPFCGTYALFYAAYSPAVRLHNFGKRGDFSYGVYLYAFAVQQLLVKYVGPHLTPWGLSAAAFVPTLLLAIASWYCVERPCLRLKTRNAKRQESFASDGFMPPPVETAPKEA